MPRSRTILPFLVLLAGCGVGSLSQTFPDSDQQFDPRLLGTWQSEDHEKFQVTGDGARGYVIVVTDEKGQSGQFTGRMGRIGKFRVLDVQPDRTELTVADAYRDLLVPLHTVLFLDSIGGGIRFRMIQPDSLEAVLLRDPKAIAHVRTEDFLLLTAESRDLQQFLASVAEQPGMLGDPALLTRTVAIKQN